ncbi:MAG TPA: biotin-dependent carboxyltransferase family protein [Chthoniobacterales bacterium]|nr:biotin-dependent carboxyltransferase family protein [Chthoniobacterales bacterium]
MTATVSAPGFLTTVQDTGRTGFRNIGVSHGGALDVHALRVANLLVGNEPSAAALEITLGGLRLRFEDRRVVTWCGGAFDVKIGETRLSAGHPAIVESSEQLTIERPEIGCRGWLAVSGGIDVPEVLGSRSTDLRAQFGGMDGRQLRVDDVLRFGPIGPRSDAVLSALATHRVASWFAPAQWVSPVSRNPILRVMRGSEWPRFDPEVRGILFREPFTVTSQADRMGVRLEGPKLHFTGDDLASEAVSAGAVQVPPAGHPIILLPDCQTIGGYPKLAHVITVDLPVAAQLRPGDQVQFQLVRLAEAHELLIERARQLTVFRAAISLAYQ